MDEETIEVVNSEEEVEQEIEETEEAPSETTEEAPTEETVETTEPTVELFELPDGRKVDADTLSREWKENFYPDYTRKSQELAKVKTEPLNEKTPNPLEDPDYVPTSYGELAKQIKEETLREIARKEEERIENQKAIENQVSTELEEIKKIEPTLNENALFQHATKYGFRDLKLAFQNMKDMNETMKKVQQNTEKNIAKRTDPVSIAPGSVGTRLNPDDFRNAGEYLRALQGQ